MCDMSIVKWLVLCSGFVYSSIHGIHGSITDQIMETTQLCCGHGTSYARNHSSEDCSSSVPPNVSPTFSQICLFAMDQCCKEYFLKKEDCENGIDLAINVKHCKSSRDSTKKCCDECIKGTAAGVAGGTRFCNSRTNGDNAELILARDAFNQCCEKSAKLSAVGDSKVTTHRPIPGIITRKPLEDELMSVCDDFAPTELCAHHCIPIPGSYKCECNPGFKLMSDGKNCIEVTKNRCKPHNPCQHKCNDNGFTVKCSCKRGYRLMEDGKSCEDLNECILDPPVCLPSTQCVNVQGSYKCIPLKKINKPEKGQCPPGFSKNIHNDACDDINECELPQPPCPSYLCENTIGAYKCGGKNGDPASLPTKHSTVEEDRCPPGFKTGFNEECEDVDECATHKDDCNEISQFCINTKGSFYCQNKVSKHCPPGFKIDTVTNKCEDINECEDDEGICKPGQQCINIPGEYNCRPVTDVSSITSTKKCSEGMRYNSKSENCEDIDECVEGTHICDQYQSCVNTYSSHECHCKLGFELDTTTGACVDINECATDQNDCIAQSQRCDNTVGSYLCIRFISCGTGYILHHSSSKCEDIDECALGTHNCARAGPEYKCHNIPGSFRCIKPRTTTTTTTAAYIEYEYYDSGEEFEEDNKTVPQSPLSPDEKDPPVTSSSTTTTTRTTKTIRPTESSRIPDVVTTPKPVESTVTERQELITEKSLEVPTETPDESLYNNSIYKLFTNKPESAFPERTESPDNTQPTFSESYLDSRFDPVEQTNKVEPNANSRGASSNSSDSNLFEISYIPDDKKSKEPTPQTGAPTGPEYKFISNEVLTPVNNSTYTESSTEITKPSYSVVNKTNLNEESTPQEPHIVYVDVGKETATVRGEKGFDGSVIVDTKDVPSNEWTKINMKPTYCQVGFKMDQYGACFDIDECATNSHICSGLTEICQNSIGSYVCECAPGFHRDYRTGTCALLDTPNTEPTTSTATTITTTTIPPPSTTTVPSTTERNSFWGYRDYRKYSSRPFKPSNICDAGYHYNTNNAQCEDINECTNGQANCAAVEICVNTEGGYRCECPPNWKLDDVRHRCVPVRDNDQFPVGYGNEPDISNYPPADPNEIITDKSGGSVLETEINLNPIEKGPPVITCPWGYKLADDYTCKDINECITGEAKCGFMQMCFNLPGGYTCSCPHGHRLIGDHECEDIDECSLSGGIPICSQNADCVNTIGSYQCRCHDGFRSAPVNDKVCVDVDECTENRVGALCQQRCNNVWGGYRCSCHRGYRLNFDNSTCTDVDECTEFKSKNLCIGKCLNEPGSYRCTCPSGYRLSEDKRSCIDIDECETGEAPCANSGTFGSTSNVCINTRGSYRCHRIICPRGYQLESKHRCTKMETICQPSDWHCAHQPSTYSYNFITFVSKLYIPESKVDLFTMRGPAWQSATMRFELRLVEVNAPPTVEKADITSFLLVQKGNQGIVSLVKSLEGPQSIELELSMELYNRNVFGGIAVAKLYLYVSEYEF